MNAFLSIIPACIQVTTIFTPVTSPTSFFDSYFYTVSATGGLNTESILINTDSMVYTVSATGGLNTEFILINMDSIAYTVSAISLSA